jgi:hypothetical protein
MEKMNRKTINRKVFTTTFTAFLSFSIILAAISMVIPLASAAAPSITLSPSQAVAGSSVTVTGTVFAANSSVGIGFGTEVTISGETVSFTISGGGPYTGIATLAKTLIKPGTFSVSLNGIPTSTDDGAGAFIVPPGETNLISATLNYVTGKYTTISTQDPTGHVVFTATYTTYGNNVSPAAGITTTASGSFTANITVPSVSVGNYTVTAIDTSGKLATNSLSVSTQPIPEGLTIGVMLILSTIAVTASVLYFRKRPKFESCSLTKP